MKLRYPLLLVAAASVAIAHGQKSVIDGIPYAKKEQLLHLNDQANELFQAAKPAIAKSSKSTVTLYSGAKRLCLGTVINGRTIVSKASELTTAYGELVAVDINGEERRLTSPRVSNSYDLAFFQYEGSDLPELDLSQAKKATAGEMLFLSEPSDNVLAMGVVSVTPRSLRAEDRGFLGIMMDERYSGQGVMVSDVTPNSPAYAAGLRAGSIILKIGDREINGMKEAKTILQRLKPGDKVSMVYDYNGKQSDTEAILAASQPPEMQKNDRTLMMQQMGARLSNVRDEFPNVIQSDMQLEPENCGGPVTNLSGDLVGIVIARSSRIQTFIIPGSIVLELVNRPVVQQQQTPENRGGLEPDSPPKTEDKTEVKNRIAEIRTLMNALEKLSNQKDSSEEVNERIRTINQRLEELEQEAREE